MHNIFKGLKVIDLSTVLAGPSVGTFFGELGAHVLKIENVPNGDVTRTWKTPKEDASTSVSAYFSSVNYQKEYLKLNLSEEKHYQIFLEHLRDADILLSNFKKKDYQKLRVDEKTIRLINPKLIIGKITGFGDDSDRIAYDLILQAESGFMSMNGEANQAPLKIPVALIDVLAAHHLKEGILLAMLSKEPKTVSVSLYDAAICSLMNQASNYLMTGDLPKRQGNLHPNIAPYGELFDTIDGKKITFAIGSNKHYKLLCKLLEMEDEQNAEEYKTNQLRVQNRAQLQKKIMKKVATFKAPKLLEECHSRGIPCAQVKKIDEVLNDPKSTPLIRKEFIENQQTFRITSIASKWK